MSFEYTSAIVSLATDNLESLVIFYTKLLQQNPQPYLPGVYSEFQISGLRLGIFQPKLQRKSEFAGNGKERMSLCLEMQNLEEAIAHLTNLGYPPLDEVITASHGKEVYVYDPDGNRLILHQS